MSVLSGLQAAFPSTVHNVVRTARKLIVPEAIHDRDERTVSSLSAKNKGSNSLDMCALGLCSFCFSLLPLLDKDLFQVETSTVTTNEKKDSIVRSLCYRCKRLKRVLPTLIGE